MEQQLNEKIDYVIKEYSRISGLKCYFHPCTVQEEIEFPTPQEDVFCRKIAASEAGYNLCYRKRKSLVSSAILRKDAVISPCHCGLGEIIMPLFINKELVGVFISCVPPTKEITANILKQSSFYTMKYNLSLQFINEWLEHISHIEYHMVRPAMHLLKSMVFMKFNSGFEFIPYPAPQDFSDFYEDEETGDKFKVKPASVLIKEFGNEEDGYQSLEESINNQIDKIYVEIRTRKSVQAKESFKKLFKLEFCEEDFDFLTLYSTFLAIMVASGFLKKISMMADVYPVLLRTVTRIKESSTKTDLRNTITDYFDALNELYGVEINNCNAMVERMVQYIDLNFNKPITITTMAKELNLSIVVASRMFKEYMGINCKQYLNEKRMSYARHLLRTTDLPVSQIAQNCGYSNIRGFFVMFKKHYGLTCTQVRQMYEAN